MTHHGVELTMRLSRVPTIKEGTSNLNISIGDTRYSYEYDETRGGKTLERKTYT